MRVVIVAGPRAGKSWLARELHEQHGWPVFCGDPRSKVKDPESGVTYLPEHVPLADTYSGSNDGAAAWIADNWFTMPGPWICEGWVMARALRRWALKGTDTDYWEHPCDRIVVFENQRADQDLLRGQVSMHAAVGTVWRQVRDYYDAITEYRT